MIKRVRKPFNELQISDFEACPCWEFAIDEESRPGQDETTVRPLPDVRSPKKAAGPFHTLAAFFFPNGRLRQGSVTLGAGEDMSDLQPILLLEDGLLAFYVGAVRPTPREIASTRKRLRAVSDPIFPIYFTSVLRDAKGNPYASGRLDGLYAYGGLKKTSCLLRLK